MRSIKMRNQPLRALLSDFLPFELPAGFSNRSLYKLLISARAKLNPETFSLRREPGIEAVLRLLFGPSFQPVDEVGSDGPRIGVRWKYLSEKTVPYKFRISHGLGGFRELAIPHPGNQLAFARFYHRYAELVTYFGGLSNFSVRKPAAVARMTVVRDDIFEMRRADAGQSIETVTTETDILRSYFTYSKYASINEFFESRDYIEAEQSFSQMLKLDVSKCFESIYSHSIEWAIYGRATIKSSRKLFADSFPSEFDKLMRAAKEDETNGILIGPEISRVFAELVMQRIDREVEREMVGLGFSLGSAYRAYRYVDDFYVFSNSARVADAFQTSLRSQLHIYGLHLNDAKTALVRTPYLSPVSIAKSRARTMADYFTLSFPQKDSGAVAPGPSDLPNLRRLISGYKLLLAETNVDPEEIANYFLVLIEERLESGITSTADQLTAVVGVDDKAALGDAVCSYMGTCVELALFVYSGSGRASAAVKAARICALVLRAARSFELSSDRTEHLKQVIFSEVRRVMARYPLTAGGSVESLYLFDVISELGSPFRLSLDEIVVFADAATRKGAILLPDWMHSMVALALLRNVGGHPELEPMKRALAKWAVERVHWLLEQEDDHAERAFLVLDLVASPHIARADKLAILRAHKVKSSVDSVVDVSSQWFTPWEIHDLHSELLLKRSQHVY
ncbi:antiviral reverse transcriptase Drt3b [Microbacterium sp. F1-18]